MWEEYHGYQISVVAQYIAPLHIGKMRVCVDLPPHEGEVDGPLGVGAEGAAGLHGR